ncbi:hypothetical protein [Nocardioides pacificus]
MTADAPDTDALLVVADALYALPLPEFTPARDARAKELKAEDKELAARVKGLRKPSTAAWVVNLLVRREADEVAQVVAVGEALRQAQADLDAAQLRELTKQRRMLTAAVTTRARRLAREEGHKVTEAVAEQVEATLTAAMIDEGCARAVRSGLLVSALAATGVGEVELADAVALPDALGLEATRREGADDQAPAAPRPELRVVPDPDAELKARRAADERLAAAEESLAEAESALASAASEVEELEARGLQISAELEELRRRLDELETRAEEVEEELADAEDVRAEAEEVAAQARRERDASQAGRDALG